MSPIAIIAAFVPMVRANFVSCGVIFDFLLLWTDYIAWNTTAS
jgi:hypothetical protein